MKLILDNGKEWQLKEINHPSIVIIGEDEAEQFKDSFIHALYNDIERQARGIDEHFLPKQYIFKAIVINGKFYFPSLR